MIVSQPCPQGLPFIFSKWRLLHIPYFSAYKSTPDFWLKMCDFLLYPDLRISRGRFFAPYFGGQKLDLYAEKYGKSNRHFEKCPEGPGVGVNIISHCAVTLLRSSEHTILDWATRGKCLKQRRLEVLVSDFHLAYPQNFSGA